MNTLALPPSNVSPAPAPCPGLIDRMGVRYRTNPEQFIGTGMFAKVFAKHGDKIRQAAAESNDSHQSDYPTPSTLEDRIAHGLKNLTTGSPRIFHQIAERIGLRPSTASKPSSTPRTITQTAPPSRLPGRTIEEMRESILAVHGNYQQFKSYADSLPAEERPAFASMVAKNLAAAQVKQRAEGRQAFVMEASQFNSLPASDRAQWTQAGGKVRQAGPATTAQAAVITTTKTPARPEMTLSAWKALSPKEQHQFIIVQKGRLVDDPPVKPSRQEDLPKGTVNRATLDGMTATQRNAHFRSGGHLVD